MDSATTSIEVEISGEKRRELAKEAFWGNNEPLADQIKIILGYRMDERFYPANGFDLAEAIKVVGGMDGSEILKFISNPQLSIVQDETELLHGDEASMKMVFNNLTGRNFSGGAYEDYLAWAKNTLAFSALAPEKVFLAVK